MLKRTTNSRLIATVVALSLSCIACSDDDERSWQSFRAAAESESRRSGDLLTSGTLESLFNLHYDRMTKLVLVCEVHESLRRVGLSNRSISYYGHESDGVTLQEQNEIQRKLGAISASALRCQRRGDIEGNPLAVVSFVMQSKGLAVSGELTEIFYWTDWSTKHHPLTRELARDRGYIPLSVSNWYASRE